MSSISPDLYGDGRDDLALFILAKELIATLTTTNSITSEFIPWNNNSHKKIIKGLLVNTKMLILLLENKVKKALIF